MGEMTESVQYDSSMCTPTVIPVDRTAAPHPEHLTPFQARRESWMKQLIRLLNKRSNVLRRTPDTATRVARRRRRRHQNSAHREPLHPTERLSIFFGT